MRQLILQSHDSKTERLQYELKALHTYVEEAFTDNNDINKATRMQLELINQALAELQVKHKEQEAEKTSADRVYKDGGVKIESDRITKRFSPVFVLTLVSFQ